MKQINIEWKGELLTIGEHEAFELGERIEEIVTLTELSQMGQHPKFRKLARCYAEMINFAGGRTSPAEVHAKMMDELKGGKVDQKEILVAEAVSTLIDILMDGAPQGDGDDDAKKEGHSSKTAS